MSIQAIEAVTPGAHERLCCRICRVMGICYLVLLIAPMFLLLSAVMLALWVFMF
ncbi:MAG: hypothetical protein IPK16_10945 [Anaerolineales bacterium]|nr:hypothetical protein [Anaerolineales bacterium]